MTNSIVYSEKMGAFQFFVAVRDMARSADILAILTESEKFHCAGTVPLNVVIS